MGLTTESYDTPDGVHEQMTFGRFTLYRHDYDGPMVIVTTTGMELFAVHAAQFEMFLFKQAEKCMKQLNAGKGKGKGKGGGKKC